MPRTSASAELAEIDVQARLVAVDRAAERLLLDADVGERGPRGKLRPGDLDRGRLAPRVSAAAGPVEVAAAALRLLGSHRVPFGLRHRDLDRDHVVERIEGIQSPAAADRSFLSPSLPPIGSILRKVAFDSRSRLLVSPNVIRRRNDIPQESTELLVDQRSPQHFGEFHRRCHEPAVIAGELGRGYAQQFAKCGRGAVGEEVAGLNADADDDARRAAPQLLLRRACRNTSGAGRSRRTWRSGELRRPMVPVLRVVRRRLSRRSRRCA